MVLILGVAVYFSCESSWSQSHPLKIGTAAIRLEADDSMVIAGGIHPGKAGGQEGELRATAIVLEQAPHGKIAIVACDILMITGAFWTLPWQPLKSKPGYSLRMSW